ncbi:MAG: hypothetical protein AB7H80_00410 [Candidatus Kapaibacterium sp.]
MACLLMAVPTIGTFAQHQLIREVMGSGGDVMKSDDHVAHGTISQTTIGRVLRPDNYGHNIGFWYWAKKFGSRVCVRLPRVAAEAGSQVVIPLILEESTDLLRRGPLRFRARIRFNGTLLEPTSGTPACQWEGNDCVLEVEGVAEREIGVIAELVFIAKLGNDVNTPLIIEEFEWFPDDNRKIETIRKHGEFTLLGICREGEGARLILSNSGGVVARLSAMPNPASEYVTVEFIAGERGVTRIVLVDGLGSEQAVIVNQDVEGDRIYSVGVDLSTISSGSYFLVMKTPTVVKTTPLIVRQ